MALTKLKTEGAFIMPKMDATWGGSEPSLDDEGVSQLLFRPFRALSISISTQGLRPGLYSSVASRFQIETISHFRADTSRYTFS